MTTAQRPPMSFDCKLNVEAYLYQSYDLWYCNTAIMAKNAKALYVNAFYHIFAL